MRKLMATIGRMLAAMAKWTWIGGRLVLQPLAACIGMSLFSEEEVQAGWDHVERAAGVVGRGLSAAARGVAHSGIGESLVNTAVGVGKTAVAAATDVLSLPGKVVSAVGSALGGGGTMDPGVAAAQAAAAASQETSASSRDSELRSIARVLQRVLDARAAGERPSQASLDRLPEGVRAYVMSITEDEVRAATQCGKAVLVQVLAGQGFPGCRAPVDVRAEEATVRRSQLVSVPDSRLSVRSVDDILGDAPAIAARR